MIEYPKYTIVTANRPTLPFVILEHGTIIPYETQKEEIGSKMYGSYETFEEAIRVLATLSDGPIILAASNQLIDNTFRI